MNMNHPKYTLEVRDFFSSTPYVIVEHTGTFKGSTNDYNLIGISSVDVNSYASIDEALRWLASWSIGPIIIAYSSQSIDGGLNG